MIYEPPFTESQSRYTISLATAMVVPAYKPGWNIHTTPLLQYKDSNEGFTHCSNRGW
jgi:hypothetical protein